MCRSHGGADRVHWNLCSGCWRDGPRQRLQMPHLPRGLCAGVCVAMHGLHTHLPQALPGQMAQHEGHLPHLPALHPRQALIRLSSAVATQAALCWSSSDYQLAPATGSGCAFYRAVTLLSSQSRQSRTKQCKVWSTLSRLHELCNASVVSS